MIALQTLKYKILEWCLDTFLNKVLANFNVTPNILVNPDGTIDARNLQEGMYLSEIRGWSKTDFDEGGNYKNHHTWLNCRIVEILKYNEREIDSSIHVGWTYSTYLQNGEITADPPNPATNMTSWFYDPYQDGSDDHIEFYI